MENYEFQYRDITILITLLAFSDYQDFDAGNIIQSLWNHIVNQNVRLKIATLTQGIMSVVMEKSEMEYPEIVKTNCSFFGIFDQSKFQCWEQNHSVLEWKFLYDWIVIDWDLDEKMRPQVIEVYDLK